MSDYLNDLSKMLRTVRLACGFSQNSVAAALDISRPAYTYYETGRTMPDILTLKRLAAIFSIPAEAFLYPEDFLGLAAGLPSWPSKPRLDLSSISQLSPEEKSLIARYRARGGPSGMGG